MRGSRLARSRCSRSPRVAAAARRHAEKPKQAAVDERTAEKDAKGLVTRFYQTIGRVQHRRPDGAARRAAHRVRSAQGRRAWRRAPTRSSRCAARSIDGQGRQAGGALGLARRRRVAGRPARRGRSTSSRSTASRWRSPSCSSNEDDFWRVAAAALAKTPSMKSVRAELEEGRGRAAGHARHPEGRRRRRAARSIGSSKGLADQRGVGRGSRASAATRS